MTLDEMKDKARARIEADNLGCTGFKASRVFEHIMEGTVISVSFLTAAGKEESNHVHFGRDEVRVYRWHGDILAAVAGARERIWFFRFIELAGVGGVIAFFLVLIFSLLLCVLAFSSANVNPSILEVVKLSFTIILGFFFGSQSGGKKAAS